MEVGRRVGRKDYDGAIRVLERSLSNTADDSPSLVMIALCHRWSKRNDDAVNVAQRVLSYDKDNFEAIRLLSAVHADKGEHDLASKFVRMGIEKYPEPTPSTPRYVFWLLRIGASVFPRLRRVEESTREHLADPDRDKREWYSWAKQYLAWYDSVSGKRRSPTVH